jgi:REP element-mobilizing transposase RayT
MARGIERSKIFKDDKDRSSFLDRLADILEETQTQCYAWALIPNHFHILLRRFNKWPIVGAEPVV